MAGRAGHGLGAGDPAGEPAHSASGAEGEVTGQPCRAGRGKWCASGGARALSGGARVCSPESSTSLEGHCAAQGRTEGPGAGTAGQNLPGLRLLPREAVAGIARSSFGPRGPPPARPPDRGGGCPAPWPRPAAWAGPGLQSLSTWRGRPEQAEGWHEGDPQEKSPVLGHQPHLHLISEPVSPKQPGEWKPSTATGNLVPKGTAMAPFRARTSEKHAASLGVPVP